MRIGRVSKILAPGYGWCLRCQTAWLFVKEHVTEYTPQRGMFPLCQKCWNELIPQTRLPFYLELWEKSNFTAAHNVSLWSDVERAVFSGK